MFTIAKLTCKETIYKKIFLVALLMTLGFLVFYGVATHYFGQKVLESRDNGLNLGASNGSVAMSNRLWANQFLSAGLYMASFITSLLTILASVGSIASEIESHQIDTILSRPIRRSHVVLGKYVGLCFLMGMYSLCMFLGILFLNHTFGSAIRVDFSGQQILRASLLFVFEPLLLTAVALVLSVRTATVNAGVILIILYGVSFIGGFMEQIGAIIDNSSLVNMGIVSSLIFPLDSIFRKMNTYLFDSGDNPLAMAASGFFGTVSTPNAIMILYSIVYTAAMLALAIRTFQRRDV
jgi:Cu-processing system permease protein